MAASSSAMNTSNLYAIVAARCRFTSARALATAGSAALALPLAAAWASDAAGCASLYAFDIGKPPHTSVTKRASGRGRSATALAMAAFMSAGGDAAVMLATSGNRTACWLNSAAAASSFRCFSWARCAAWRSALVAYFRGRPPLLGNFVTTASSITPEYQLRYTYATADVLGKNFFSIQRLARVQITHELLPGRRFLGVPPPSRPPLFVANVNKN